MPVTPEVTQLVEVADKSVEIFNESMVGDVGIAAIAVVIFAIIVMVIFSN